MKHKKDSTELVDGDESEDFDPYAVLGIDKAVSNDAVRLAYRRKALRCHPDKQSAEKKEQAHHQFQKVTLAYSILNDETRRRRYDETGFLGEADADLEHFDWKEYFASTLRKVDEKSIEEFKQIYQGSPEERQDILAEYVKANGDLERVMESVICCSDEDEDRFKAIIDEAISQGDIKKYKAYINPHKKRRAARDESAEAAELKVQLGLGDSDEALNAAIKNRVNNRMNELIARLENEHATKKKMQKKT